MNKIEEVEKLIKEGLPDAYIETMDLAGNVENLHLGIFVASNTFSGKMLIEQHQVVMDILKEKLDSNEVHAVKLKTMTLDKYHKLLKDKGATNE